MKSILLTSSPSSSSTSTSSSNSNNNLSLLVGSSCSSSNNIISKSHSRKYQNDDDDKDKDNSVNETVVVVDKQEFTNKLLSHSNSKSQVIKSKIIAKDNDKIRRSDNKNIFSNTDYERWQKKINNNLSDVNSDCLSLNLENHPLIDSNSEVVGNESDNQSRGKINATAANSTAATTTTKLINLRKKNGTALIFQRKISSQQQKSNCEYQDLEIESFKKRQSLQWPQKTVANNHNNTKTRHYSWYDACNYTREPIEEEFENSSLTQFTNEHNNLAEIKTIIASSLLSINTESDENVPEDIIMKTSSIDNSTTTTTTATTGATSKRWHNIEQFLKNLVGKRSSSSSQVPSSTINNTTTTTTAATAIPATTVNKSPSAYDLFPQQKSSICGSTISLSNKDRLINKSTASLNSTSLALVHQKLWSVVPLLSHKDGGGASCNNLLSNENSSELTHRMRKCETVLALTNEPRQRQQPVASTSTCNRTHSKSINNLLDPMPMRPLNRLRNSQSCYVNCDSNATRQAQNCSRCSSLLSLAAIGGSSYSLTNGAFVLKDCKHSKHTTHKNTSSLLSDEDFLVTKTDSSNHNLIENDFNSIEPYDTNEAIKVALATVVKGQIVVGSASSTKLTCKLCLGEYFSEDKLTAISSCGCIFCTECMKTYVEFEISEGAYELSCPDALCSSQGVVSIAEISQLASSSLVEKHHRYRLNREVELDKYRLWCPNRNCETICSIPPTNEKLSPSTSSQSAIQQQPSSSSTATLLLPRSVLCPTCNLDFCSSCKKAWHPSITCDENSKRLGSRNDSMMLFDNDLIKNCPMCSIPIEKDEGCAQMMCKRCKHVFCWYCLASLDDDFLLRHYDKGPCKNKLGHSRASVVWHRAQVIGIFAGFGILLLVASPLLLLAAPCIVCCKCKIEESTTAAKLDEPDHHSDHQV